MSYERPTRPDLTQPLTQKDFFKVFLSRALPGSNSIVHPILRAHIENKNDEIYNNNNQTETRPFSQQHI